MKTINVPAQITTVEDRIAGNLTLTQISLLAAPVFVDFAFYAVMPQSMHLSLYKFILMTFVAFCFFTLAIRFKDKLILFWALTLMKFKLRNKLYVFNKDSIFFRGLSKQNNTPVTQFTPVKLSESTPAKRFITLEDKDNLNWLSKNLSHIEEKGGKLYVYVSGEN